jgi:hypothetical protein
LFEAKIVDVLVLFEDEAGDRLLDQHAPGHAQQSRGGEADLQDQPLFGDGAIAYRRQIVEVEVPSPRGRTVPPASGAAPCSAAAAPALSGLNGSLSQSWSCP